MNIQLKPMKLTFSINQQNNTWDKVITDMEGRVVFEQRGLKLFDEMMNKQYFDDWENQMRNGPWWNIVEVERFI